MCGLREVDTKEHVFPKWYLKHLDAQGPPPGPWAINGEPVVDKEGEPVRYGVRQRVLLSVCGECNAEMDRRFEKPPKEVLKRLVLSQWSGLVGQDGWRAVGLWWAKVLLLHGHPDARLGDALLNKAVDHPRLSFDKPLPDLSWLGDGSRPPDDVSVFVFNAHTGDASQRYSLVLPQRVVDPEGVVGDEHVHVLTLAGMGLSVSVVVHPGVSIEHPLVAKGHAWELLHSAPPVDSDLSDLPRLGHRHVQYVRGGEVPRGHNVNIHPFSSVVGLLGDPNGLTATTSSEHADRSSAGVSADPQAGSGPN